MSFLRRTAAADGKCKVARSAAGEAWAKTHPALAEYLQAEEFEDGTARLTATITLFVEDGLYKCSLRDREEEASLWCSAGSLPELIEALEMLLKDPTAEWRPWGKYGGSGADPVPAKKSVDKRSRRR